MTRVHTYEMLYFLLVFIIDIGKHFSMSSILHVVYTRYYGDIFLLSP